MKKTLKPAFIATVPVLAGYMVLGFGFGIVLNAAGYGILVATAMSVFIYAGSMQYVAIGLMSGGASILTIALTTLAVNARHLFYGISMLDKYKNVGKRKPYLIFALTDETYSLVCSDNHNISAEHKKDYFLFVTLFNQIYWVLGSVLGAALGALVNFNSNGIDFALTALFLTVFLEQWMSIKNHIPSIIGVAASVVCLIIFGGEKFLIPSMFIIALLLSLFKTKEVGEND